MALIYHAPMLGNIYNQGISNAQSISTNWTVDDNGKIGKCIKTSGTGFIDTGVPISEWNINETSVSMCGWFKFPFSDIKERIENYSYTSIRTMMQGNLLGYNNYAGVALACNSNNMYNDGEFSTLSVYASIRKGSSLIRNSVYTVPFDQWIHLCAIFDRDAKKTYTYVNGNLYSQSSISFDFTDIAVTQNFMINVHAVDGGNGPGMAIPFYVNDVRLYDHALTEKEVKAISRGLILHYPLNNNGLGNENLVPNSNNFTKWAKETTSTITLEEDGFYHIVSTNTNGSRYGCYYNLTFPEPGEYTISAEVKNDWSIGFKALTAFNWTTTTLSGKATIAEKVYKVSYTTTATEEENKCRIYISGQTNSSGIIRETYIRNLKVEKGNKVTSYSPAPSEIVDYNIIHDVSGFDNNGTATGALSTSIDTLRYNVATNFDGSTSYIQLSDSLDQVYNDVFTISMWINPTIDKRGILLGSYTASGLYTANFELYTGHKLRVHWHNGDVDFNTAAIPLNVWTHIAFVKRNSSSMYVYKNGELFYTASTTFADIAGDIIPRIGKDYRTSGTDVNYKGGISDLRIYTTALSADDIKELYEMGVSG